MSVLAGLAVVDAMAAGQMKPDPHPAGQWLELFGRERQQMAEEEAGILEAMDSTAETRLRCDRTGQEEADTAAGTGGQASSRRAGKGKRGGSSRRQGRRGRQGRAAEHSRGHSRRSPPSTPPALTTIPAGVACGGPFSCISSHQHPPAALPLALGAHDECSR